MPIANFPLLKAFEKDNLEIVKILVENGANVNPFDTNGGTLLQNAIIRHQLRIVKFLKENGGNLNVRSLNQRNNSFELTLKIREINTLKLLLHK